MLEDTYHASIEKNHFFSLRDKVLPLLKAFSFILIPKYLCTFFVELSANIFKNISIAAIASAFVFGMMPAKSFGQQDPASFTITTVSNNQINFNATANANNDNIVVVFNLTGVFTTPTNGFAPTPVGTILAGSGGAIIYDGPAASFSHSGLSSNRHYFYKAFSYDASNNYSPGVAADAVTCASVFDVSGGGSYCSGGSGVTITLSGSETGVNYQLKNGATNVGSPIAGTGSALNFNNVVAAGTYTIDATNSDNSCTVTMNGSATVSVDPDNTISLTSGAGTDAQALCINTPIANITYSTTGATGATFSGLPAGVTGNWSGNVVTISGTPTAAGTFNYIVTLTGGCGSVTATGSITVSPNNTITLTSAAGTDAQTLCVNTAITNITYSTTGATGATFSGLPAGVTGNWAGNVVTISGTPTAAGTFNYTVTLTGGCGSVTATGSITVNPNNTITLTSAGGTDAQALCINTPIANITYSTTGATGATFSGLPAGVTGNWAGNVVTISGTPTAAGTFNYTVTLTGGCGSVTATGSITVNPNNTITLTSAGGTDAQTLCVNTAIANITYSTTGATGAAFSGLPAGVTGNWAGNVVTISGTPTAAGTFNYTVTLTGGCGTFSSTGSITVNPLVTPSVTIGANPGNNICAGTSVTFTATPTNGGTTPSYQWKVNSSDVGTNSPTFTSTSLANGDIVTVVMTSSATCPSPATATSNSIKMTVNPVLTPSVSISASATTICPGNSVTFTATPVNGGTTPSYQWQVNSVNAGTNSATFSTTSLANGDVVTVILTSNATCASPTNATSNAITMTVNPGTPATPGTITGTTPVCPGITGLTYSIAAVANATSYTWTVPTGWTITNGQGTTTVTVTSGAFGQNGNISVTASNSCGTSAASNLAVTVNPGTPATPGAITGTTPVCPGITGLTYSIAAVTNATGYTWAVPAGWTITNGQGTTSITVTSGAAGQNGNITVTATNSCGTSASSSLAVTVSPDAPATPGVITGTTPVCPGITSLTYSIAAVANATSYTWAVPAGWTITNGQGTTTVTVTSGAFGQNGNISVTASNSCGTSAASSLAVAVSPGTPATPGVITGTTPVCPSITGLTYSITAVANATSYTWTVPTGWTITGGQGTTTITVTSGAFGQNGNITVTASNSCGTSAASSKAVTVNPGTPATPGAITGSGEQCINKTGLTYSISAVTNATSYTWSVPTGWSITSGQGTTSITVLTSGTASSGNITVTASNSCGTSSAQTLAVIVSTAIPATPAAPTGQTSICTVGQDYPYQVTSVAGATSYVWTVPSTLGTINGASTGNSINVTVPTTAPKNTTSNITVKAQNACGISGSSLALQVTVGNFAFVDAGPDQTVCSSSPNAIMNSAVGGATGANNLTWSTSGSGAFKPNNKQQNPTYQPSAADIAAGTVTLTATTDKPTGCNAVTDQMVLTIRPIATASISGATTICSGSSTNITFTATANTTVTYQINGGTNQTINVGSSGTATLNTGALSVNTTYSLVRVDYTTSPTCGQTVSGTATITVNAAATANAGSNQSTCSNSGAVSITGASATNQTNLSWSTSGTGTFTNGNTLTPTYTPSAADIAAGSVTLTLTAAANSPCSNATSTKILTITSAATANAGSNQFTCSNSGAVSITGASATNQASVSWSTSGTGTFTNGNTLTPTYTPSAADIAAGSVTLTLTAAANSPCSNATSTKILTITSAATANAGSNQSTCSNSGAVSITGASATNQASVNWSTSGTGTFTNGNTLTPSYTPSAADISAGSVTLTLTAIGISPCGNATSTKTLTINKTVTITTQPSNVGVCSTFPADFNVVATGDQLTYQWFKGTPPGGTAVTNTSNISGATTSNLHFNQATSSDDGSYYVTVSGAASCAPVTSQTVTLNVDEPITISSQPASQTVCEGSNNISFTVVASANGDPLTYQWRKNGTNIPGATSSTFTINTVSLSDAGDYDVVITGPSGYTCSNAFSAKATLTVNVIPNVTNQTSTICSGNAFNVTPSGVSVGTTYTWGAPAITPAGSLTGGSAQATGQSNISQTLTNTTTNTATATYTVTPTSGSCAGNTFTVTVTVNPKPAVSNQTATICSGNAFNVTPAGVPAGTTYTWGAPAISPAGALTGGSAQATGQSSISQTLTNTTTSTATATYTVTPTSGSCAGNTFTVTVTVNPTPAVTNQTATICSGNAFNVTPSGVPAGTTYTWGAPVISPAGSITGGGAQATGQSSITQTLTNTTTNTATATYTVTPTSGSCAGNTFTVTVTVNATPNVTNQTSTICSGNAFNVTPSGVPVGTTYTWGAPAITPAGSLTGGSAQATGQSNISQTLTNTTTNIATATYTVTPTSGSCAGNTFTVTVTVNPKPVLTNQTATICSGNAFNVTPSGVPAGTTYTWGAPTISPSGALTGGSAQATGQSSISQTLTNTTTNTATATYTVTPTSGSCAGNTFTVTVTVNPKPAVTNQTVTICSGNAFNVIPSGVPAGTTYTWGAPTISPAGALTGGSAQATGQSSISQALTNTTTNTATAIYTVTPTLGSCAGNTFTVTVTVSPTSVGGIVIDSLATKCSGSATGTLNLSGNTGSVIRWEFSTNGGATWTTVTPSNTTTQLNYNVTQTTLFRAVVQTSQCSSANSRNAVVSVVPPQPPSPVTASPTTICLGSSAVLTAGTGYQSIGVDTSGNFNTANPKGWCVDGQCTGSFLPANGDNTQNGPWRETNPHPFNGINYSSPDPKFVIANGNFTSKLETPVFSLVGQTSAVLSYLQAYLLQTAGTSIAIAISTDGGATYTTLSQVNGVASLGISGSNATMQNATLDLTNYIGLSNLRLKFTYTGSANSAWVMDGISLPGTLPITYGWTLTNPTGVASPYYLNSTTQSSVTATPPAAGTYTYTIATQVSGCPAGSASVNVTVNPIPTVNVISNQTVCNGTPTVAVNFSGSVSGTVFNWTNNNISIGLAASGTNVTSIPSFTAINSGTTVQTATITVTPNYTNGGVTCTGSSTTFTITVNPTPTVNPVSNQTVCNGSPTTAINFGGTATSFSWSNNNPSIGLAATGTGNIASFTAINNGTTVQTATITVTPIYTTGSINCTGASKTFTITVNPTPTVNSIANQIVCNGSSTTAINFGGTATSFSWANDNISIGLAAGGTGNIPSFTAINNGTTVQTATITVTPNYTTGSTTCTGTPATFTITVNPTPTANSIANQIVCNGSSTTAINFAGTATSFNWSNDNTSIGLAASGTGNIASFTAINNGTTVQTATITVTPVYTTGSTTCTGTPNTFTISVNPTPTVNAVSNQTVCNGSSTTAINFGGTATSFNWSNDNTSIGLAASGTGNIASFTATNNGTTVQTATITVTPNYTTGSTTCSGSPVSFTITVNPTPTVNSITDQVVCNNSATAPISFSGTGSSYTWTNDNTSIGLAAGGTGDIPSFTAINNGTTVQTATITVTPLTNSGAVCSGPSMSFTITVNPTPTVTLNSPTKCANDPAVTITATPGIGAGTDYNYVWTVPGGATDPGNVQSFLASVAGTYSVVITDKTASCASAPASGILTVNPNPSATFSLVADSSLCGRLALTIHVVGNPNGVVFDWSRDNIATVNGDQSGSVTGTDSSGYSTANIIDTLYNMTSNRQTVNFTITPKANGCAGPPMTVPVSVRECVVLPVTIINFKAYQKGAGVEINWSALNEINFDHYEVQHSTDGTNFKTFVKVNAVNKGNISNYSETDRFPANGINYYRVKAVDKNGAVDYTAIAKVNICCNKATVTIYPNPVLNKIFNVELSNMPAGNYKVIMYNGVGQQVMLKTISHAGGSATQSFKLPATLAAGSYFVRVFNASTNVVVTLIVQ